MKALVRAAAFIYLPMLLAAVAAGIAIWAFYGGLDPLPALLVALVVLAAALVLHLAALPASAVSASRSGSREPRHVARGLTEELRHLARRVGKLEGAAKGKAGAAPAACAPAAPREPAAVAASAAGPTAASSARPAGKQRPARAVHGGQQRRTTAREAMRGFRLYMEPVVDLTANRTAFYRATSALAAPDGRIFLGEQAAARATRLGFAARHDMATLRHAAGFLRRLKARGRDTRVICPLSRASLASPRFRDDLRAFMNANGDIAAGFVMDVSRQTLSMAGEEGALGLAWLAQNGVRLCLSQGQPEFIDAPALRQLGFAWLDMDRRILLKSLQADGGAALGRATASGLEVIASGMDTPQAERHLRPLVQLARGRLYSPPRRVRMPADEAGRMPRDAA